MVREQGGQDLVRGQLVLRLMEPGVGRLSLGL